MFNFGDDPNGGFLRVLGKMFQQTPADANAPGAPMQILPQVQQDAQSPSLMDRLQSGVNKNTDTMFGLAGGLLNQKPQQMQAPTGMNRPVLPFGMGAAPMKWNR